MIKRLFDKLFHRTSTAEDSEQSLVMQHTYTQARRFLKHNRIGSLFLRPRRPWIILFGPSGSGKTTLLAQSNLNLVSTADKTFKFIKPNTSLDWWAGNNAIFIDPPGLTEPAAWRSLLQIMQQSRKPYPFNSAVLVLDINTLILQDPAQCVLLNQQLHVFHEHHKSLPITLIINQCDRLVGFNEFFADLTAEDKNKLLGFNLGENTSSQSLTDRLEQKGNQLLKQLNDSLLWRLHHEPNIDKRARIKDFPLQMERMLILLNQFLTQITLHSNTPLHGIYFTCATQQNQTVDLIAPALTQALHFPITINTRALSTDQNALFVHDLFASMGEGGDFPIAVSSYQTWQRVIALPIAIGLILGVALLWHYSYQDNLASLQLIQQNLSQTQASTLPWLTQLNALEKTALELKQQKPKIQLWDGLNQTNKLQLQAESAYKAGLHKQLQKYLLEILEKKIVTYRNQPLSLYNTLKIYLMLNQPQHYDAVTIQQWFSAQWAQLFPDDAPMQKQLQHHLQNLLQQPKLTWDTDAELINEAQAILKKLPLADIAYLELQGRYANQQTKIVTNPNTLPGIDTSALHVPSFYSNTNFKTIYNEEIPSIAASVIEGDWVMGYTRGRSMNVQEQQTLVAAMRVIYLKQYSAAWTGLINKIKFTKAQNLADIKTFISMLTLPNSPFLELLKTIANNIAGQTAAMNISPPTSTEYQTLMDLVEQKEAYRNAATILNQLSSYLSNVVSDADSNKSSYNLTAERFNRNGAGDPISALYELANNSKGPLNIWLKSIADNTWEILLNNAAVYVNNLWQTTVLPEYRSKIEQRFPIFTQAEKDISIEDFNAFFGPSGSMDSFFNYYLKPFVNMEQQYWNWKTLNGKGISISEAALQQFIRGSLIQRMFYSNLHSSPQLKFTLAPAQLEATTAGVKLDIEGQIVEFTATKQQLSELTWPGPKPGLVTAMFTGLSGANMTLTTSGPWAWLRLVMQSKVEPGTNSRNFKITFAYGTYATTFNLTADNVMNPYLPNILQQFRCPENLLSF